MYAIIDIKINIDYFKKMIKLVQLTMLNALNLSGIKND
jgi:hypothetical protein